MPDPVMEFFGRFHPLLVHLPIGILFIAGLFEFLSYFKKYRKLRGAVQTSLFWGSVFATLSAISGYLLSLEGGYDERLVTLHQNSGIATAVFAWLLFFIRRSVVTFFKEKEKQKMIRIFLFVPLLGVLALTGHLGGSLTHGEGYLLASMDESGIDSPALAATVVSNPDSVVFYQDVIEPILRSRCYGCHSSSKQKGQLRLDRPEFILKGGKHGKVINNHLVDSSALYSRMMLPLEDEKHMPPNEKPQPESSEIELVHSWIEGGASFEKKIFEYEAAAKIREYIVVLAGDSKTPSLLPDRVVPAAPTQAIQTLTARGVIVLPVGSATNYLTVNFVNARDLGDKELELLVPLREQLIWLNLARTKVTSKGLETISQLSNLRQLNLDYTAVDDSGMEALLKLTSLTSLNLIATQVGDEGLKTLSELKSLTKVFVYKASVTSAGVSLLRQKAPMIYVDTGSYFLPSRITDTLVFGKRP